jgi:glycosyltransferase involved in cell wall biosynthesis
MEIIGIIAIFAALLVLTGFITLIIPVYRFRLVHKSAQNIEPKTGFSIVVAFRNEKNNLPALYDSICGLNYPKHLIEWVLCDDHSNDDAKTWILHTQKTSPFPIIYCENTNASGKKAALALAAENATFDNLFFTDADCILPPNLLLTMEEKISTEKLIFIAGPVSYIVNHSILNFYQCAESALLMALTADAFRRNKPLMANGANLCVNKSFFTEAQAARADMQIPGGDDIFLLEYAMQKNPDACHFLGTTGNTVQTLPEKTWADLLNQRTRWAAKVKFQQDATGSLWQFFSLIFSLFYLSSICLIPWIGYTTAGIFVFGKIIADIFILQKILPYFSYPLNLLFIPAYSFTQILIILLTGLRARFAGYTWKDRKY